MKDIDPRDPRLEDALSDEPEFLQQEEQDDVSKLQSIIRELDLTGGVARIFRQTAGRAEFDYEGELPVDGFNLETSSAKSNVESVGGNYNDVYNGGCLTQSQCEQLLDKEVDVARQGE